MTHPYRSISAAPGNAYHDGARVAEPALFDAEAVQDLVTLANWPPWLAEHFIAAGTPARAVLRLLAEAIDRIQ